MTDELQRRFEQEAQAIARLRSPHTVELFDFGVADNGAFYYAMELLDGLDADALVRRFGPLPPDRAIYLLRQVCHSLAEAQACGLVHRDIKPANIFLCRYGQDHDFVKVLDFGLVKALDARVKRAAPGLTAENAVQGTPAFIAPEQAMGDADVDGRADIYATGCVAYWLLTGQYVFTADTPIGILLHHASTLPVPPSARTDQPIPPGLERVIMACLAKDPADRPQTARELSLRLARGGVRRALDRGSRARVVDGSPVHVKARDMVTRPAAMLLAALACTSRARSPAPAPESAPEPAQANAPGRAEAPALATAVGASIAAAESTYAATRDLRDRIDVALAGGRHEIAGGTSLTALLPRYDSLRGRLESRLSAVDSSALGADDARALGIMRRTLSRDLGPLALPGAATTSGGVTQTPEPRPDMRVRPRLPRPRDARPRLAAGADLRLLRLGPVPRRGGRRHARPAHDPRRARPHRRPGPAARAVPERSSPCGAA